MNLQLTPEFLSTETEPWDFSDPPMDLQELAMDMVTFMHSKRGVGLSANQVGLPLSIFCMKNFVDYATTGDYVIINPFS